MSIARNSGLVLGAQIVGIVGGVATSILTARFLGPSGRGVLILVSFSLTLLGLFAGLGLNQSLVYMIGKQKLTSSEAMGVAVAASIVLGGAGVGAALLSYPLLSGSVLSGVAFAPFAIGLVALPAAMFNDLWAWMRIGENRFVQVTAYQSAVMVTSVGVAAVALWVLRLPVTGLLVGMTCATYAWSIVLLTLSLRQGGIAFRIDRDRLRELAGYGLRVYAGSLVNSVYLRLDTFVLNMFGGTGQVGVYSIAVSLNERIWTLDSAVSQTTRPLVVSTDTGDAARLTALTSRTVMVVATATAMVLGALSSWLVPLLYGNAFEASVGPLLLLLPGTVLYAGSKPFGSFLSGQLGRPGLSSAISAGIAVASVGAYLALIPPLGASGAALASSLVYGAGFTAGLLAFTRLSGLSAVRTLMPRRDDIRLYRSVITRAIGAARRACSTSSMRH
jgi:O-antigen/teichoic acid export membrane protein